MDINFDDMVQLLEFDFQDCNNKNKKSFSTIVTLPVIKHHNNSSNLLDVFDLLHIQTIYRNIHGNDQCSCEASHNYDYSFAKQDSCGQDLRLFLALRNIEIKKEYQQQGICTKLIQCLLEFCQKHKINF